MTVHTCCISSDDILKTNRGLLPSRPARAFRNLENVASVRARFQPYFEQPEVGEPNTCPLISTIFILSPAWEAKESVNARRCNAGLPEWLATHRRTQSTYDTCCFKKEAQSGLLARRGPPRMELEPRSSPPSGCAAIYHARSSNTSVGLLLAFD